MLMLSNSPHSMISIEEEKKENDLEWDQCYHLNPLMNFNLHLNELEVLICNLSDIENENFKDANKRNIVLPFDLFFIMKSYLVLTERLQWFRKSEINLCVNNNSMRISLNDIQTIKNIIFYQLSKVQEKEKGEKKTKFAEEKTNGSEEKSESLTKRSQRRHVAKIIKNVEFTKGKVLKKRVEMEINMMIYGLQIILINDQSESFVPVLEFEIFESFTNVFVKNDQNCGETIIPTCMSYFNPKKSRWEPVIEKFALKISFAVNPANFSPNFSVKKN